MSALVEDLQARGLDRDVTVIAWGEFGRTPKINKDAGRDHWPPVSCALLAGGGMRAGQAIGATNRFGEEPVERPVHFQEVFATLYHNLGIDAGTAAFPDFAGNIRQSIFAGAVNTTLHRLGNRNLSGCRAASIMKSAWSRTMGPVAGPTDMPSSYSPALKSWPGSM